MMTIEEWLQKEWPIKPHEGSIGIIFSGGKYLATIKYFIFNRNGSPGPKTDWAAGDTPDEAFSGLWQEALLTIKGLKGCNMLQPCFNDLAHRFLNVEDRP